jgi:hypothetical protein
VSTLLVLPEMAEEVSGELGVLPKMAIYSVAQFNGGFYAGVEVSWNSPLSVRFDVLVDP